MIWLTDYIQHTDKNQMNNTKPTPYWLHQARLLGTPKADLETRALELEAEFKAQPVVRLVIPVEPAVVQRVVIKYEDVPEVKPVRVFVKYEDVSEKRKS